MHRNTQMCMQWSQDVCCWLTVNVTASLLRCITVLKQIGNVEFGSLGQWFSSSVGTLFLDGFCCCCYFLPCMNSSFYLCSLTSIPCLSLDGVSDSFLHNMFTVAQRMFISFVVKSSSHWTIQSFNIHITKFCVSLNKREQTLNEAILFLCSTWPRFFDNIYSIAFHVLSIFNFKWDSWREAWKNK